MNDGSTAAPGRAPATALDWRDIQARLQVQVDGNPGKVTYAALLSRVVGRSVAQTVSAPMAQYLPLYDVDASADRLAAWIGQTGHESLGYTRTREIWGPTKIQRGYEGRKDLGNTIAGDGFRFRGGGWIEVTGRYWFAKIGQLLGIDLTNHPELADQPDIATRMSLEWWRLNKMNVLADHGDIKAVTREINPGLLGLDERARLTSTALDLLG